MRTRALVFLRGPGGAVPEPEQGVAGLCLPSVLLTYTPCPVTSFALGLLGRHLRCQLALHLAGFRVGLCPLARSDDLILRVALCVGCAAEQ